MKVQLDQELEIISIDGVDISLEVLKAIANPDPTKLYRMKRDGNVVTVEVIQDSGSRSDAGPCESMLHGVVCKLKGDHTSCHAGQLYGSRIYWTDAMVQCDASTMRDGSLSERALFPSD